MNYNYFWFLPIILITIIAYIAGWIDVIKEIIKINKGYYVSKLNTDFIFSWFVVHFLIICVICSAIGLSKI